MNGYYFVTLEAEVLPGFAILELQGHHTHADEIGAMDALEALGNHGAHAEQPRPLGRPIAR